MVTFAKLSVSMELILLIVGSASVIPETWIINQYMAGRIAAAILHETRYVLHVPRMMHPFVTSAAIIR